MSPEELRERLERAGLVTWKLPICGIMPEAVGERGTEAPQGRQARG